MARRWLLTVLTGAALSVGVAGSATAQELDPVVVETDVATATVTADSAERTIEAELETDAGAEELDTEVSPTVTATVTEDGPTAEVGGTVEVADEEVPLDETTDPVEDAVAGPAPVPQQQTGAGDDVAPAPEPAGSSGPAAADSSDRSSGSRTSHSSLLSADGAAYRSGYRADSSTMAFEEESALAPEVAPPADALPLVAAAAPVATTELALPIIDPTPTVPGLLRLLAGLLVVGAAATWQTVRSELA